MTSPTNEDLAKGTPFDGLFDGDDIKPSPTKDELDAELRYKGFTIRELVCLQDKDAAEGLVKALIKAQLASLLAELPEKKTIGGNGYERSELTGFNKAIDQTANIIKQKIGEL